MWQMEDSIPFFQENKNKVWKEQIEIKDMNEYTEIVRPLPIPNKSPMIPV